jgi:hypothetical protein
MARKKAEISMVLLDVGSHTNEPVEIGTAKAKAPTNI